MFDHKEVWKLGKITGFSFNGWPGYFNFLEVPYAKPLPAPTLMGGGDGGIETTANFDRC